MHTIPFQGSILCGDHSRPALALYVVNTFDSGTVEIAQTTVKLHNLKCTCMQMYALLYMSETLLAWHFNDVYPCLDLRLLLSTKYVYGGSLFLHVFFFFYILL